MSYHHFKGNNLSRSESVQRFVVRAILARTIADDLADNSIVWELKHSSSCIQIGRLLALKRGLDVEMAEVICALHDIAAIETGRYRDHAPLGAKRAGEILRETNQFSEGEIQLIQDAIAQHSDKQDFTDRPWVEFMKDADALDCSLYEGAREGYLAAKTPEIVEAYFLRFNRLRTELGLPIDADFIL